MVSRRVRSPAPSVQWVVVVRVVAVPRRISASQHALQWRLGGNAWRHRSPVAGAAGQAWANPVIRLPEPGAPSGV